jgi:predicted RNA-binding protein Jag
MKDPVFSGRDVADALRSASRTLGVPDADLRYVVLDSGSPGGRGLSPTEARIAVLLEARGRIPEPRPSAPPADAPQDLHEGVRALVTRFAEASGLDLAVGFDEARDVLEVRLSGAGTRLFLEDEEGETLAAFEHVLDRAFYAQVEPRRLRLVCDGFRERRDEALKRRARELAERVRASGQPHLTAPLNAYERRIVHMTLNEEPDITTFSVGDGREKRVTVALAGTAAPGDEGGAMTVDVGGVEPAAGAPPPTTTAAQDAPASQPTPGGPPPQRMPDPFPKPPTERSELM